MIHYHKIHFSGRSGFPFIQGTRFSWHLFTLLAIFFTAVTPSISTLWAQDPAEVSVRRELQDLNQLLAAAREVVAAFPNPQARDLLNKAESLRKEAESKLANQRLRQAQLDIRLAAQLAQQVIKLALKDTLPRLRQTLEELIRRAEHLVSTSNNREAERLLRKAKEAQIDAERALQIQSYSRALQSYQLSKSLAEKVINLVQGHGPALEATPEVIANRAREHYQNLEARAREALEKNASPAALRVYQQAIKQGRDAEEARRRGNLAIVEKLYNGATRLLLRAIDLSLPAQRDNESLKNQVAFLQDFLHEAEQSTKESMDPRAPLLLERARALLREAEVAIERQQIPEARWRLELARNFIDRAMRRAGRTPASPQDFAQRCQEALQELAHDLQEVGGKARDANHTEALQLVELATSAHKMATNACRQAQQTNKLRYFQVAFQLIRTAQRFLLRAETLLQDASGAPASGTRETAMQQLAQLEAALQELSRATTTSRSEFSQSLVQQAMALRDRARLALERGHYHVAVETIAVAFELIRESVKLEGPNQNQQNKL